MIRTKSVGARIVAGALFAFPTTSIAADWQLLAWGKSEAVVFVDTDSVRGLPPVEIRRPFEAIQLWVKMDFSQDRTVSYREQRQLYRVNCAAETMMIGSSVTYSANGSVVDSWSEEDYDFHYKPQTPETIGYAIMEFACGRRGILGQR
jgi:hypothetical protein